MKKYLSKILMMLVFAAFVLPSQAQLLKLVIKDKALQQNIMFTSRGDIKEVSLDANNQWTYDNEKLSEIKEGNIFLMDKGLFIPALLEPGKTSVITVTSKKGKPVVKYTGDNVDRNRYLEQYMFFSPEKFDRSARFADIDDEEMREDALKNMPEDISFEEAFRRLDKRYAAIVKAAKAVKDPQIREKYLHQIELKKLTNLLDLNELRCKQAGIDKKKDAEYQRLAAQIDPNDEMGLDQILHHPDIFLENKLTTTKRDQDQTAYALDYLGIVNKYITNENVRHKLLSDLGMLVFNSSYTGQVFEMDKFWPAFKKAAPKKTIDYFQPIYDSRLATKAGQPCPDVSFSDPQGNPHKLSEYFGKVLYIDIWATWCGPCCAEIPYIEKHVAHYKDNPKIQFISISIDSNKQAWHNKLEKDKPEWMQFLCNKEEYELISKQWGITGIPRFVIINADGTINNSEAFRPSAPDFRERIDKIIGEQ